MSLLTRLSRWVDVRPGEGRLFLLSTVGAFLVISFVVASRAIRDAFFLDEFSIEALPYITIAVAILALPTIGLFSRFLSHRDPGSVYRSLLLVVGAGIIVLQAFTDTRLPSDTIGVQIATVGFYLWTAIATLLITSGFWIVTAERFALRDAKRLFGMVSGGGTLGAMLTGLSLDPLAELMGNSLLVIMLTATLLALWFQQRALPPVEPMRESDADADAPEATSLRESMHLVLGTPHLRNIALIVGAATMASFMVDYQFKGVAAAHFTNDEALAGFFGQFYGITGVLALLLQVLVASRLLSGAGVAAALAVLPATLLIGSTAMLFIPGLALATAVRGADNSLRRSTHRTVIEYLYVPIAPALRRRTKTFIDSSVDSGAEGLAAVIVAVVVAVGLDLRGIALLVMVLSCALLVLGKAMGRRYFETLLQRLQSEGEDLDEEGPLTQFVAGEATVNMNQFDIDTVLTQSGLAPAQSPSIAAAEQDAVISDEESSRSFADRMADPDPAVVMRALAGHTEWAANDVELLSRLLARDALSRTAVRALTQVGNDAVPGLTRMLVDESSDFVIRRRIPRALGTIDSVDADRALVLGLTTRRFEVRYRSGVALARRRRDGRAQSSHFEEVVWEAIRSELGRERPIWELQRLLDDQPTADDLVAGRVYGRGELSLEHTFRLLSLVLDSEPIRTAFHGIILGDNSLKSLSLEYLEQTLPADVRARLWPFIGDISDFQRQQQIRPKADVISDLLQTGATLFGGELERERLREALREPSEED